MRHILFKCPVTGLNVQHLLDRDAMLVIAVAMIWGGRPNKDGVHPSFLRFNAAMVIYPPIILAFFAMGTAAVISSIW